MFGAPVTVTMTSAVRTAVRRDGDLDAVEHGAQLEDRLRLDHGHHREEVAEVERDPAPAPSHSRRPSRDGHS